MVQSTKIASKSAAAALVAVLGACAVVPVTDEAAPEREFEAVQAGITCGADTLQELVGTSVGELDSAMLPDDRRVIFPGMAVTQDFRPDRLNIDVGPNDRITRVYCG